MKKKIYIKKLERIFVILDALRALSNDKNIVILETEKDRRLLGNMPTVLEDGLVEEISPPERVSKGIRSFKITKSGKEVIKITKLLKKFKELEK
ncbi:MAG: hypothetical protein RBR98_04370 [Candidatus Moranbacteria bacterium]|jgi:hypothetical protein|nr:hypothetical protein [Candidatus Moranbacteria bacterium]